MFRDRTAVIATMHQKEKVIAPLLKQLGIEAITITGFDTDRFGTFTRDRERPGNQLETAKLKARSVLELCDHSLAVASEGSFFPHPALPMVPCNREIVLLYDKQKDIYFWAESVSLKTNFNHSAIQSWREAREFAQKIGFPDHGLVVKTDRRITKGIIDFHVLEEVVTSALKEQTIIFIETDMRALYNPTRMENIAQAAAKLVAKLQSFCPHCGSPGFDVIDHKLGLPCSWCGMPTQQIQALIYGCQFCTFTHQVPEERTTADPQFCSFCNP